jgi:hypothetical protein
MAAHASMEASSIPAAAEIAWLMQEEHSIVNPRAYEGTRSYCPLYSLRSSSQFIEKLNWLRSSSFHRFSPPHT